MPVLTVDGSGKPPPIPVSTKPPPIPVFAPRLRQPVIPAPPILTVVGEEGREKNAKELAGIGGWLILVAIGQVLGPLKVLASIFDYYTKLWTKYPIAAYGEAALNMSLLALICYTTYLFFQRSRLFPKFFVYEYVATILFYPLDVIFTAATLNGYTGQSIETVVSSMMTPDLVGPWIAAIITAAIWIPYIKLSKRVANTFVS
jgi:Protein of unknown function (DUF2569)